MPVGSSREWMLTIQKEKQTNLKGPDKSRLLPDLSSGRSAICPSPSQTTRFCQHLDAALAHPPCMVSLPCALALVVLLTCGSVLVLRL